MSFATLLDDYEAMSTNGRVRERCERCRSGEGERKRYRDPFAAALSPGRWPTMVMHSDCFLAYIRERKASRVPAGHGRP